MVPQLIMFNRIFRGETDRLEDLIDFFVTNNNVPAMLVTLDHFFAREYHLEEGNHQEIAFFLQRFLTFVRTLQRLACDPTPCDNASIQKLFAFAPINEENKETFFVSKYSYLSAFCDLDSGSASERGLVAFRWALEKTIR